MSKIQYVARVTYWGHNYPAPDDRRCAAIAMFDGNRKMPHRCGKYSNWFRDGRLVCIHHFKTPTVEYVPECGDHVGAYREMMARALGDV